MKTGSNCIKCNQMEAKIIVIRSILGTILFIVGIFLLFFVAGVWFPLLGFVLCVFGFYSIGIAVLFSRTRPNHQDQH